MERNNRSYTGSMLREQIDPRLYSDWLTDIDLSDDTPEDLENVRRWCKEAYRKFVRSTVRS